jgi:hypothetical protein
MVAEAEAAEDAAVEVEAVCAMPTRGVSALVVTPAASATLKHLQLKRST